MEVLNYFNNMYQLLRSKQGDCDFLVDFKEKSNKFTNKKWQYAGVHIGLILLVNLCCLIAITKESPNVWLTSSIGILWLVVFSLIQMSCYLLSVTIYMYIINTILNPYGDDKRYHYLMNLFLYCTPIFHLLQILALNVTAINTIFYIKVVVVLFVLVNFFFLNGAYKSYERNAFSELGFYIMGTAFGFIFARFNSSIIYMALRILALI